MEGRRPGRGEAAAAQGFRTSVLHEMVLQTHSEGYTVTWETASGLVYEPVSLPGETGKPHRSLDWVQLGK